MKWKVSVEIEVDGLAGGRVDGGGRSVTVEVEVVVLERLLDFKSEAGGGCDGGVGCFLVVVEVEEVGLVGRVVGSSRVYRCGSGCGTVMLVLGCGFGALVLVSWSGKVS